MFIKYEVESARLGAQTERDKLGCLKVRMVGRGGELSMGVKAASLPGTQGTPRAHWATPFLSPPCLLDFVPPVLQLACSTVSSLPWVLVS